MSRGEVSVQFTIMIREQEESRLAIIEVVVKRGTLFRY